jgi:Dolichyl-phosphate-mannose-protein mannosyltransferase
METASDSKYNGRFFKALIWVAGGVLLFVIYTYGLTRNPPGFYIDESAFAYNAYLISRTGVAEFGVHWPLYFQNFTFPYETLANPVCIYLLALVNLIFPPGIWLSRFLAATAEFFAAPLLGWLAFRISRRRLIGMAVGGTALITPWLYEIGRLYFDSSFYPLVLALFLLALYHASSRENWRWLDVAKIAIGLGFLTYTYTIGRMLAPLLALGLVLFVMNRQRMFDVTKVWIAYGVTLIPLGVFNLRHRGLLTSRFKLISYVYTEPSLPRIVLKFVVRYFQDLSLFQLLINGDDNPRHHAQGTGASMLLAPFVLSLLGVVIVIAYRRRDRWWRYIVFATLVSVIPAALTKDAHHTGRLIAYQIFLLVLMIPALEWLSEKVRSQSSGSAAQVEGNGKSAGRLANMSTRQTLLAGLLIAAVMQAVYFQVIYWNEERQHTEFLDVGYKPLYDAAVQQSSRPIYLVDGTLPAYVHALWYATLEGRPTSEFVHVKWGEKPPPNALVISSEDKCADCQILLKKDQYMIYRKLRGNR